MANIDEQTITDAIQRQWPDRVSALKELVTQRMNYMERISDLHRIAAERALQIFNVENRHHLTVLNGEAGKLATMQATYTPREVSDQRHEALTKALQVLTEGAAYQSGRGQVIAIVVSFFVSVSVVALGAVITYALRS